MIEQKNNYGGKSMNRACVIVIWTVLGFSLAASPACAGELYVGRAVYDKEVLRYDWYCQQRL